MAGGNMPFYAIPFDSDGTCTAPRTVADLHDRIIRDRPTHTIVFSHGWNNDWGDALRLYRRFVDGVEAVRATHDAGGAYRPFLVGVFWPSMVLVGPGERSPLIAGGVGQGGGQSPDPELVTVGACLPQEARSRLYELAAADRLAVADREELLTMLAPLWAGSDGAVDQSFDELPGGVDLDEQVLGTAWRKAQEAEGGPAEGSPGQFAPGPFAPAPELGLPAEVPAAAGWLDALDPRNIIRLTTVLLMKDRAGRVGARGVSPVLGQLLADGARVHLAGHSYGAKVVLSALSSLPGGARPVESVLLLQPAASHLCFAATVPGLDGPGGYRPALSRSRQPIVSTFSSDDVPLTRLFHLVARRRSDLGDLVIAGAGPSRYAALGGYGPAAADDVEVVGVNEPGVRYRAKEGVRALGVQASGAIGGHSDISKEATWWMLYDQLSREG